MKAIKGCMNTECRAYRKIHYKQDDEYCLKCGEKLSFVCAKCWKPMEDGMAKYCISCKAAKEQNHAEKIDMAKKVAGALGAVAVAVPAVIKNTDNLVKHAKNAADAVAVVIKVIKK